MAKNLREIPATEIVERTQKLGRLAESTIGRIWGVVQDTWQREIASKFDWNFLLSASSLITTAQYTTGTLTANTGDTTAVLSSDASITSAFTGRQLKPNSNDVVYDITFSNTTAATISPSLQGNSNLSGVGYTIFQPFYTLASDFDRFPSEQGLIKWNGGNKEFIKDITHDRLEWNSSYSASPSIPARLRLIEPDTAGTARLELNPPPQYARIYSYDYFRKPRILLESTGQLLSISAGATTILGLPGQSRFTEMTTGDYIRVDALGKGQDSWWYRIATITNDSSLTITTVFASTAITSSANFTISRVPDGPPVIHTAILYGTLRSLMQDQNDPQWQAYQVRFAEALSDAKAQFVTRIYNQEVDTIATEFMYRR